MLTDLLVADVTSVDWDNPTNINLVEAVEAMDEEAESNGSTVADIPLYSRLTGMRLNLFVRAANSTLIRWALHKRPDGEATNITSSMVDANFHSSDDTEDMREFRKYCIAKGMLAIPSDRLQAPLRIRVSRAAWKRISPMRENDTLTLTIAKASEGTTATVTGFGTIWCRANG